ncbi:MAG TPA: choice-of-anchor Q domain-containing protein [Rudaea sp.]|jgi:parallel beta-helix repeat protein
MNIRAVFTGVVAAIALIGAQAASATTTCVSTTAGLRSAMNAWQTAGGATPTIIKLVQGTYLYPNNDYWTQEYYGGTAPLQLLGGYTAGCAGRSLVASNTVIDGQQVTTNSQFQLLGQGSVLVEGIMFKSLAQAVVVATQSSAATDSVTVRYVIGTDLFGEVTQYDNSGGFVVIGGSNVRVESSLFHNVHGGDTASALQVFGFQNDNFIAVITNVTVAYNGARGMNLSCFQCSGSLLAYNNIFYNNTSGDLDTRQSDPSSEVLLAFSDFNPATSAGLYFSIGNFNADPKFENPLDDDFLLLNASPAINAGAPENIVPGGYGGQDLDGGTRVVGSLIDLGAYESIVNDQVGQVVTSKTDDTFTATLREAILTANSNVNATTISFNLGNAASCPQVITLSSPLPDITSDVTINGFSEPGSKVNTQYGTYDGQLCVILRASGSVDHALKVSGAGRLTAKGMEFEGFSTAAVLLATGNGSIVVGNGFSAIPGSAANDSGVLVQGTANNSLIGSLAVGDRNVFDQGSYGIYFEANGTARANTVEGNYLGYNFDGTPWAGANPFSNIYLSGSGGNTIRNNYAGGAKNEGILLSGSNTTGNTLAQNIIGQSPSLVAAGGGSAGIGIVNGAHGNVIGTSTFLTQSGGGNLIVNNSGPGIWVESTAGVANRIDGNNVIHDNSGFLAVDLGASTDVFGLGPTPNDSGDVDVGPNNLENYPTLTQATRIEAKTIALDGYVLPQASGPTQNYRIDVFWTDTCTGSGPESPRGEMKRYVGFFFVNIPNDSFFITWPGLRITAPASIPKNGYLFATATDAAGNTSEPGKCFTFTDDYIFGNGFN